MSAFQQAIGNILPLSKEAYSALLEIIFSKSHKQDDFVLKQDGFCKHLYFLNKGLVRIYYHKAGRDITEWFATDHQFCFSIISYFKQVPSNLTIQCLEDCEIIYLPKIDLEQLASQNLEISKLYRLLIASSLIISQVRMESIQFETALQRYQRLIETNPEIVRRAPLKYIASFLGITFETLSRIRNQLH